MGRAQTKEFPDKSNNGRYFELKKTRNQPSENKSKINHTQKAVIPSTDVDLKVDDSNSEIQQASDLIVLDEVHELPNTPTDSYLKQ